ncbi:MAG: SGNH/GDSL hydrolase family protein [Halioglobus sp.]
MKVESFTKCLRAIALGSVLGLCSAASQAMPNYSDVFIFGDSLSDTGNVRDSLGILGGVVSVAAGYGGNGRFSNGPVWHEYLTPLLGLPAASNSLGGGNNYAYGGAIVDSAGAPSAGILTQSNDYLADVGGVSDPGALYIAWIGGNDVRGVVGDPVANQLADINDSIADLQGMLGDLISSGANTVLVPNLPDLGQIPEFAGGANSASASAATLAWNMALEDMLTLVAQQTMAEILYFDVYSTFNELLGDPAAFGFTNTTGQCRSVTTLLGIPIAENECANSSEFLFWDEIHPTTAAHAQLGQRAFDLLNGTSTPMPLPLTVWLFTLGLVIMRVTRATGLRRCR